MKTIYGRQVGGGANVLEYRCLPTKREGHRACRGCYCFNYLSDLARLHRIHSHTIIVASNLLSMRTGPLPLLADAILVYWNKVHQT